MKLKIHPVLYLIVLFILNSCGSFSLSEKISKDKNITGIRTYPTMAIQKFNLAELYRQNKEYARAVLEYQDASLLDTLSATIQIRLAESFLYMYKYEEAVVSYQKALKITPNDVKMRNIVAQIYQILGKVEKAEKEWLYIIDNDPEFTEALIQLTKLLKKQNRLKEAIFYSEKLVDSNPENGLYQYELIRLYLMIENENKAVKVMRSWVKNSEDKLESILFLTNFLISQNSFDEAYAVLKPCQGRWQENWWISHLMAMIFENKHEADSIRFHYKRAISFDDAGIIPFEAYAFWAYDNNLFQEAIEVSDRGLERDSTNLRLHLLIGNSYEDMDDMESAINEFEILYQMRPKDMNILHKLALLHDGDKNYSRSDVLYFAILEENEKDDLALNNWSYSLAERGSNLEKALKMSETAIQLNPENAAYYDTKAWILYKNKNYEAALSSMYKAFKYDSLNAELYYHIGEIVLAMGEFEKAREYFEKAIKLAPDYVVALKRLEDLP